MSSGLDVPTAYSGGIESKPKDADFLQQCYDKASSGTGQDVTVLDVGCGDCAQSLRFFAQKGAKVTGVDISEAVCEKARCVCRADGFQEEIQILQDDMICLGRLPAGLRYRAVCSFYSLHHVDPSKVETVIETLAERIEPGGLLVIAALTDMRPGDEDTDEGVPVGRRRESLAEGKRKRGVQTMTERELGRARLSPALRSMHRFFASIGSMETACRNCGLIDINSIEATIRHDLYENEFPCSRLYFTANRA